MACIFLATIFSEHGYRTMCKGAKNKGTSVANRTASLINNYIYTHVHCTSSVTNQQNISKGQAPLRVLSVRFILDIGFCVTSFPKKKFTSLLNIRQATLGTMSRETLQLANPVSILGKSRMKRIRKSRKQGNLVPIKVQLFELFTGFCLISAGRHVLCAAANYVYVVIRCNFVFDI